MYRFSLIGEPVTDDFLLPCMDCKTGEMLLLCELEFSIAHHNRDIDMSAATKLRYGKDFVLPEDKWHNLLSVGGRTVVYEVEHEEFHTEIVQIGYLKAVFAKCPKADNLRTPVDRAVFSVRLILEHFDSLYSKRYASVVDVKRFTDNIALSEDFERKAMALERIRDLSWATNYIEDNELAVATCKRGILSINAICEVLVEYKKAGRKDFFASGAVLGFKPKDTLGSIEGRLEQAEGIIRELIKFLETNNDLVECNNERQQKLEMPERYTIGKVTKEKSGAFRVSLIEDDNSIEVTEVGLTGLLSNDYTFGEHLSFDLTNARGVGIIYPLDNNVVLEGFASDSCMKHFLVYVLGFTPILLSLIDTDGMSDKEIKDKVASSVTRGMIKRFEDKCGFTYREYLEMKQDFFVWLESNKSKYKYFDSTARASDKRYEGVLPLVIYNRGVVRVATLISWYNKRSEAYKSELHRRCQERPIWGCDE